MSSEPPEEPEHRSEFSVLSPASPKPIHFPTPTNILVLENQMDVAYNQTEAHMSDPAMHNTEVRADFWRDPTEQNDGEDHASPYSTGGEGTEAANAGGAAEAEPAPTEQGTHSNETAARSAAEPEPVQISNSTSHEANANLDSGAVQEAQPSQAGDVVQPLSDPSVPAAEVSASEQASYRTQNDASHVEQAQAVAAQPFNGSLDVQALLNTLQTAPSASTAPDAAANANAAPPAEGITVATTLSPSNQTQTPSQQVPPGIDASDSSPTNASGLGVPPASGLPPRPPPQEQPLIHPNYVHSQHIRDYHPHAANPAFQPHARTGSGGHGNVADPNSHNFVPPVHSPAISNVPGLQLPGNGAAAAYSPNAPTFSGSAYASNGQPPGAGQTGQYAPGTFTNSPSTATGHSGFGASPTNMYNMAAYSPATSTAIESRREYQLREGQVPRVEDRPWDAETQRKYDRFIEDERRYVSEGRWEQFPQGSRLFVGNLSSEKVTKRDIFHVFHLYGELAQISIKQAYGFVQFLLMEDCMRALDAEQGTRIRDKNIHLEVSKPQKNRNPQTQQRRSRSPAGSRPSANVDRYVSGAGARVGNNRGSRDSYGRTGGYRSPSPRGYRDRYRSRSPPDYGYGRGGGRYGRSPSPRRDVDDGLPLPRRLPKDVPEVQILVLDSLDRDFISWVEQAFSSRAVRVDVLLLSPRLSEQAVVRRQIVEGVVAVSKLTKGNQNSGKIGLQIFDRRAGVNNVKFEEYDGLDPAIAAELVLRAKPTHAPPPPTPHSAYSSYGAQSFPPAPQQSYGSYAPPPSNSYAPPPPTNSYGQPPQPIGYAPATYGQPQAGPPPQGVPPNLQNLITNLDPNNLQSLLTAMGTPQSAAANPYSAQSQNTAVQALQQNPAVAGYLQQQQQQQAVPGSGGGQVNMQDILARLGQGHAGGGQGY